MSRIAFIGVGNMGGGMAVNQVKKGNEVIAFDLAPAALEKVVAQGCKAAGSVAEAVTGADVVITMLPAGQHVRAVYAKDVFPNASTSALLIDCSTIDVESARAVAGQAKELGFRFVDAPVSGGIMAADAGTLAFMVGCDDEVFPDAKAAIDPMARVIIHAGAAGGGQAAKICNNMLLGISMVGVCEAFALAEKLGLDPDRFFDVASQSSGQCWSLTAYSPWPGQVPAAPSNRNFEGGFMANLMLKDLKLAQEAASKAGATTPLGGHAEALYAMFVGLGYGAKDFSAMMQLMRGKLNEL